MGYVTDWKPTAAEAPEFKCRKCGSHDVHYREWESSDGAHDDLHYKCGGCQYQWWIEGADA